jgi:alpha-beta hydrolase superfamily lysophospholipase
MHTLEKRISTCAFSRGILFNLQPIISLPTSDSRLTIGAEENMETNHLLASDSKEIFYRVWLPENNNIHSVLHIYHGMAEHSARYDRFATYLNSLGIAVYAQDHRGHGMTASDDELGWFADKRGWLRVVEDGYELDELIHKNHPGKDLFLLGHSMGSFLVRSLIPLHPQLYRGAIISGTGASQGLLGVVGKLIAQMRSLKNSGRKADPFLDNLSFGSFGRDFQPQKTSFDWLSRDEQEVQAYIDDPLCGFVCSSRFFIDLLDGIAMANSKRLMKRIPKDFPMLIISGANDPVGAYGKGVEKVYKSYLHAGLREVTINLIKGARHELLNEKNREDIHKLLGRWLESHKSRKNR